MNRTTLPCPCARGDVPRHTTPGATTRQRGAAYGEAVRAYWASRGVVLSPFTRRALASDLPVKEL